MKIKVETIKQFTYGDFDKIKDTIERKGADTQGQLNVGDTFVCDKATAEYLMGKNEKGDVVVKVIEVIPEKKIDISPKDTKAESETIIPLDKEAVEKIEKEIKKHINPTTKKKKTSKK